ncbi:cadherin-like domain-containing protein [Brachybacterium sp. EF45031]|uniref:Ig-like domain-containing protein n=1 Tax=Brachybacterium sillae TaxID=2810536 RepID=UPI00217ED215|nr:Ig-like domain-containing protein [Brachybacterium sillae]MCS6712123.1 cadherin-like domain-containing protein [Brachybacterium sillae]
MTDGRPPLRTAGTRVVAAAALVAAPILLGPTAPAAHALGEDGPFPLPLATTRLSVVDGGTTRTSISGLLADDAEPELVPASARLVVPSSLPEERAAAIDVSRDALTMSVPQEGTWRIEDGWLYFTPVLGFSGDPTPIALTVKATSGAWSLPTVVQPVGVFPAAHVMRVSGGEPFVVDLRRADPQAAQGALRLTLDGLAAGATVTRDGTRVVVPEEGAWTLDRETATVSFEPSTLRPMGQLSPVRYVSEDEQGLPLRYGEISTSAPVIPDLTRAAPYGQRLEFEVSESAQFIDFTTLQLVPQASEAQASPTGDVVTVPGQGEWALDRVAARVVFVPESAEVRRVSPMGLRGSDGAEAESAIALLEVGYPGLLDRYVATRTGQTVDLEPLAGSANVRAESLRFDPAGLPSGARIEGGGLQVTVPGQGVWRIDEATRSATFDPDPGFAGNPDPVTVSGQGLFSDGTATARLHVAQAPQVPILRDDVVRGPVGTPLSVDLLANDTAAGGDTPLLPDTVRLRSLRAANVEQLENATGTRIVIPEEGTYTVSPDGRLTFTPVEDFTGHGTPLEYTVEDRTGGRVTATITVDADPSLPAGMASEQPDVAGTTTMLQGVMPGSPMTFAVYSTVTLMLTFAGAVSVWIGNRMQWDPDED